jgi:hypothetical protein
MIWRPFALLFLGLERFLERALCVIGALAFSQLPEFFQQYLQRLGGHLDEARRQLEQFRDTAAHSGLTLDQLIDQTNAAREPVVAGLGKVMADTELRVQVLSASEAAIRDASVWTRPFVFLRHCDPRIAHATWLAFKPAVPTTAEGALYAGAGMLVLLALYHGGVRYPVRRAWNRRRLRRPVSAGTG